jgi:uncharacterized protein (TIGR03067 family)
MKIFIHAAIVIIAVAALIPGSSAEDVQTAKAVPSAAAETALLQGIWKGTEVGRESLGTCTLTVSGDTMQFQGWSPQEWYKSSYTLPAGSEPKQLRGTIAECPVPEMVGRSSTAIYKIEGGQITLAGCKPGSGETPRNFEPAPGVRIFVFKKES